VKNRLEMKARNEEGKSDDVAGGSHCDRERPKLFD
jgi:hypothetical protein